MQHSIHLSGLKDSRSEGGGGALNANIAFVCLQEHFRRGAFNGGASANIRPGISWQYSIF